MLPAMYIFPKQVPHIVYDSLIKRRPERLNMASSKTVKNPTQSSNKWFPIIVTLITLALTGGVIAYIKLAPSKVDNAIDRFEKDEVNMSLSYNDGVVTLENDPQDNAKTISIYEDFSCTYCAQLAQQDDESLKEAIESGDIILNIHTMNFLDRGEIGNSTATFVPALAMARDGNAEQYWNYRKFNFFEFETVSDLLGSDDDYKNNLISDLGFDEKYFEAVGDDEASKDADSEAKKNIESLEKLAGDVSSPRVFWDTEEINVQTPGWVEMIAEAPAATMAESQGMTQEELDASKE